MSNDSRVYDILSALASNQPTKATDLFKEVLEQRIADGVRRMVHTKEDADGGEDTTDTEDSEENPTTGE